MEVTREQLAAPEVEGATTGFSVQFPSTSADSVPQDKEFCLVKMGDATRRIRFHDYHEIYSVPGLYEHIFYDKLECQSPALLGKLLEHEVTRAGESMEHLTVLDVGAGNGIMGEVLTEAGADTVVGVDILEEAAQAAERDRPGLYAEYHPVDLLDLPPPVEEALETQPFNCLTMVAALGFGDIPPDAFRVAYNFIADDGFVAFNLRDMYLDSEHPSGFAHLVHGMLEEDRLEELVRVRYVHRLSITGEPLYYTGIIGRKLADLPPAPGGNGCS